MERELQATRDRLSTLTRDGHDKNKEADEAREALREAQAKCAQLEEANSG